MSDGLTDQLEIRELTARFTDAVNRRAPRDVAALFAEDGEWHVPGVPVARGREAVANLLDGLLGNFDRLIQVTHSGHVDLADDAATATWYLSEFAASSASGKAFTFVGTYRDELVRTAEGWRFGTRAFDFLYRAKGDAEARWYPHPAVAAP
jgi:uncharacterized protein (TIGR02246 family)